MTAPAWFSFDVYFENKLKQLQATEPGAHWDSAALQKAFLDAGYAVDEDGMYRHFVEYGNAENVSPNSWFQVNYYMNSKLEQMRASLPGYSLDMLWQAFGEAHISCWDHYTLYGMYEGVNPSADMNTNAYMNAKLAQMRGSDPDYSREQLDEAFRAANLNPIEHWLLYGRDEGLAYTPGGPVPLPDPTWPLTQDIDVIRGPAGDQVFLGSVDMDGVTTLNPQDQIDGGPGNNALIARLGGQGFDGFYDGGFMKNVATVYVDNSSDYPLTFDASGISGVKSYVLSGPVELQNLADANLAVTAKNPGESIRAGHAAGAVSGIDDAMRLILSGAGTQDAPCAIYANDIENLAIEADGDNFVNLVPGRENDFRNLEIEGSGNLRIAGVNATLYDIEASGATGDIWVDASGADMLRSASLGSGDDVLTLTNPWGGLRVNGGGGSDELVIADSAGLAMAPQFDGVEALTISGNSGAVSMSGKNAHGVRELNLHDMNGNVTLADFGELAAVNVTGQGPGATDPALWQYYDLTLTGARSLDMSVGDGQMTNGQADSCVPDRLFVNDVREMNLELNADLKPRYDTPMWADLRVNGNKMESLHIDDRAVNETFNPFIIAAYTPNLRAVDIDSYEDLALAIWGEEASPLANGLRANSIDIDASGALGDDLQIAVGQHEGDSAASVHVTGSRISNNHINTMQNYAHVDIEARSASANTFSVAIGGQKSVSVNLASGSGSDSISLFQCNGEQTDSITVSGDLGGGNDTIHTYFVPAWTQQSFGTPGPLTARRIDVSGLRGYDSIAMKGQDGQASSLTGGTGVDEFYANALPAGISLAGLASNPNPAASAVVYNFSPDQDIIHMSAQAARLGAGGAAFASIGALAAAAQADPTGGALANGQSYYGQVESDTVFIEIGSAADSLTSIVRLSGVAADSLTAGHIQAA